MQVSVRASGFLRGEETDQTAMHPNHGRTMEQRREQAGDQQEAVKFSEEQRDELRRIRRLQTMISMIVQVIYEDPNLTIEEASEMTANAKRAALNMFPEKELAYDLLMRPRLQRALRERFRTQ